MSDNVNLKRKDNCETCPLNFEKEKFENDTLALWERAGLELRFKFSNMLRIFYQAIGAKNTQRRDLSVYSSRLIDVYDSEDALKKADETNGN